MKDELFRHPPLSAFLSDAEPEPSVWGHCEALAASSSWLIRMAAVGLLLEPHYGSSASPEQRRLHDRVGRWIEMMPAALVLELEDLAVREARRQIEQMRGVDTAGLDPVRRLELDAQRRLIEAVNAVLLRARRVRLEGHLTELDDLLPPGA